jgi:hypothetical protein
MYVVIFHGAGQGMGWLEGEERDLMGVVIFHEMV